MTDGGGEGRLRALVNEVMDVEQVVLDREPGETLRAIGTLRLPADEAFAQLRPRFEEVGHTPFMRREEGRDVIRAVREVFRPETGSPRLNILLFVLTVISVLIAGTTYAVDTPELTLNSIKAALPTGLLFTASMLGILGTHEMGHYLMARRHGVAVTLPYFIPFPTLLGTMGAIIAMKEPAPNRRVQFDIGVAGPLAGLVVAIPVLVAGLLISNVMTLDEFVATLPPPMEEPAPERGPLGELLSPVLPDEPSQPGLMMEGNSLLYLGLKYAVFGKVLPSTGVEGGTWRAVANAIAGRVLLTPRSEDVSIHAVAFAGWAGLLVTAINLIPVGQLDGGHVLYGLAGKRARLALLPFVLVLVGLSFLYSGWLLLLVLVMLARRNATVLDEITDLDAPRRWIGILMLVIFVLIFVPVPLKVLPLP